MLEVLEGFITDTLGSYGYLAVFLLMVVESSGIPIPSEVTMVFGGFLASRGRLNFALVALIGAGGNLVGAAISYTVGRVGGRPLAERLGRYVLVRKRDIARAEAWFRDRGEITVFVCRMIPVVRAFVSIPAGMARMPVGRFLLYTALGTLPWTFALAGAGFLLGANWEVFLKYGEPVSWVVLAAGIGLIAWWIVHRLRERRLEEAND